MTSLSRFAIVKIAKEILKGKNKNCKGSLKGFLAARARAKTRVSLMNQNSTPEVKSCVKSREPEIKSAENICF